MIQLANESALGLFIFSWTSPSTGIHARIMWGPGMTPMVSSSFPGRPGETSREIANPGRFGWQNPAALTGKRQQAAVRSLAKAYAEAFEADAWDGEGS